MTAVRKKVSKRTLLKISDARLYIELSSIAKNCGHNPWDSNEHLGTNSRGRQINEHATNNAKYEMRGQARVAVAQQVRLITGNGDRNHRECRDYHYNHSC
jgi:hypothetical protein